MYVVLTKREKDERYELESTKRGTDRKKRQQKNRLLKTGFFFAFIVISHDICNIAIKTWRSGVKLILAFISPLRSLSRSYGSSIKYRLGYIVASLIIRSFYNIFNLNSCRCFYFIRVCILLSIFFYVYFGLFLFHCIRVRRDRKNPIPIYAWSKKMCLRIQFFLDYFKTLCVY